MEGINLIYNTEKNIYLRRVYIYMYIHMYILDIGKACSIVDIRDMVNSKMQMTRLVYIKVNEGKPRMTES